MSFIKDLKQPLLKVSTRDVFTLEDACAGVHIFGGIGSGKTSGSGKMLAGAYLRAGMGGLVTAVKPEEVDLWLRYTAMHGRAKSLVLFDEYEGFNFLTYELARQGMAGINSVTECLMRVLDAAKRASPSASNRGGDAFWEDATRQVLRYTIKPLYAAYGNVTIDDILRFIYSAPTTPEMMLEPEWKEASFVYATLIKARENPAKPIAPAEVDSVANYWLDEFSTIPSKTRGNIVISIGSVLDRFRHGRLKKMFCGRTTIVPEMTFHGSVIVLAMPTLRWNEDGVIAQQLFKYMWQRAVLSRNGLSAEHRERPVFLWSDEAQDTVNPYDAEFQSICRGSKACTVFLTQSLPTYFAKMGGDAPRDATHALVGKFMTNIFHANACAETNEYAARVIGRTVHQRGTYNRGTGANYSYGQNQGWNENSGVSSNSGSSTGKGGGSYNSGSGSSSGSGSNWGDNRGRGTNQSESYGYSEAMEYEIEPGDFARILKNGGPRHNQVVTGVWFQGGRLFKANGKNFLLGTFAQ